MERMKLNIQMFSDGKVVIDTQLNSKNFESGLDRMQSATRKAGGTIKNIVVGLGITKLVSVAMGQITSSIDSAISRVDTLNNFPKVMSNLGIGAQEAQKSIDKMSDKLTGLPTTLDQGAMAVQRFTSKNGDVAKSTDLFLALNNAILSGGASSEIQATALEQLAQAYAKGKPDMMEWRSAMTAMPAQLKQVAKAMGYVNADELGQALRDGSVSMDDFMDTIVKLNEEGVDGFQSFEKQARNSTAGINTAITVAKTQVVKGVADIIGALNKKFENTQFGSLAGFITDIGKNSKLAIDEVAKLIKGEISAFDFGKEITGMATKIVDVLRQNIYKATGVGIDFALSFINGIAEGLPELWTKAQDLVNQFIYAVTDKFQDILDTGLNLAVKFAEGFESENVEVFKAVNKLLDKILGELTKQETINKLVDAGIKIVFAVLVGMIKAVPQLLQIRPKIQNAVMKAVSNLPSKMVSVGVQIVKGIWQGIVNRTGQFGRDMDNWVHNAVARVKRKLGIRSPSRVFRDEVGKMMAEGIGVGFDDGIKGVYNDMQHAIDLEQAKLQANVETGKVFNTLQNSTPVVINLNADVEMDSTKVGRLVTPTVTRTIKNGGGV